METGDKWKKHRKFLQPAFAPAQLRYAAEVTATEVSKLVNCWKMEANVRNGFVVVDIFKALTCVTLDIIGYVAFSHDFRAVESYQNGLHGEAHKVMLDVFNVVQERVNFPQFIWSLYGISDKSTRVLEIRKYLDKMFEEIMSRKKADSSEKRDLLERLLALDAENSNRFTKEEIFGEVVAFMLAGHELRSKTLLPLIDFWQNDGKYNDFHFNGTVSAQRHSIEAKI
ncbi:Cytochrome P450 4X1 [Entophlyctis luteolus]|nr:Cytochrome P450 4X1 [Entophlyctis luteolus]KAJ3393424.1 Cytochrome P450 4X1 [Entophlyctis sp. JEL0112]